MKINNVNTGKNTWCGPAVISSITGCTTDEAAKVIQGVVGNNKPVVGVFLTDLCEAFKRSWLQDNLLYSLGWNW